MQAEFMPIFGGVRVAGERVAEPQGHRAVDVAGGNATDAGLAATHRGSALARKRRGQSPGAAGNGITASPLAAQRCSRSARSHRPSRRKLRTDLANTKRCAELREGLTGRLPSAQRGGRHGGTRLARAGPRGVRRAAQDVGGILPAAHRRAGDAAPNLPAAERPSEKHSRTVVLCCANRLHGDSSRTGGARRTRVYDSRMGSTRWK